MVNKYSILAIICIIGICITEATVYYVLNIRDNGIYKMVMVNPGGTVETAPENKLTYQLLDFAEASPKITKVLSLITIYCLIRAIVIVKRKNKEENKLKTG